MIAIVYTDALLAVPYAHLRMTNRSMRYAVLRILFVGVSVALNIVLIGQLHWGVSAIFFANLAANLCRPRAVRRRHRQLFRARGCCAARRGAALWAYALPIMPAMLAVMLVENGDRIVLNYLPDAPRRCGLSHDAKDVVGIYSFNYKLGVAMLLVVQMFRMAWTPFSLQHARRPTRRSSIARTDRADARLRARVPRRRRCCCRRVRRFRAVHHYVKPEYWSGCRSCR